MIIITQGHIFVNLNTKINLADHDDKIIFDIDKNIFKMNLDLINLGVGALDGEFNELFRRAFSSRMLNPDTVKKME